MAKETHPDIRRTLLFLVEENRILLAMKKRGFGAGKWNGVGGKIEAGESIEEALVRETQEEIGVTPLDWKPVAELDFVQDSSTDPWHMYVYAFISHRWEGNPKESEEMAPQWFAFAEIPYADMWDDDEHWLPRVLSGELITGTFIFDEQDKMTSHTLRSVTEITET